MTTLQTLAIFLKEINRFNTTLRRTYTADPNRFESDAEHSWHLALILLVLEKDLPAPFNLTRALKMALIHDLPEIYAGDTYAYDTNGKATKQQRETVAADKLFTLLPPKLEKEFRGLYREYEANKTGEARVVKALDKIQPLIQNLCSGGKAWKENNLTYGDVDTYKRKYIDNLGVVTDLYRQLMEEARTSGLLPVKIKRKTSSLKIR
jgi:putative hydrolase of HD superfamily